MIMMTNKTCPKLLPVSAAFILILLALLAAAPARACFTIVAGKNATVDGSVIMAHNEDNSPPQVVNHYKITRIKHEAAEKIKLFKGGQLQQAEQTWAYIWSEMPGMLFSDSYVNEWGVAVTSNGCPSRQDSPVLTEGGIGFMLRRLIAQRAKSAREGVLLAGKLVERFGYNASGRTYIICDPNEGWLFCVVNGKQWLAKKVPDDHVAMLANTYTVRQVDLTDKQNHLACADIIEYAVQRGWYNPERDGPFDFAAVYAHPHSPSGPSNYKRQWSAVNKVAASPVELSRNLPFSVVPKQKMDVAAAMKILRDHYENTKYYKPSADPHKTNRTICHPSTQTSFVLQLRNNLPSDIGILYWLCLAKPCTSFYIPFYFGIDDFPRAFYTQNRKPSQTFYRRKVESFFQPAPNQAFWTFSNFAHKVDRDYETTISRVKAESRLLETGALTLQKPLEETALKLYHKDKALAMQLLANYSKGLYLSALEATDRILSQK